MTKVIQYFKIDLQRDIIFKSKTHDTRIWDRYLVTCMYLVNMLPLETTAPYLTPTCNT